MPAAVAGVAQGVEKDPSAPRPSQAHDGALQRGLRLAVLGDSIGYGQGARMPTDRLGPRLAAALEAAGFDVELHVLAVPRSTSADLAAQVRRALPLDIDLAVVVVGANDLARFVPPADAARALAGAVADLRGADIDVIVVPAPDMSVVPFVPPAFRS